MRRLFRGRYRRIPHNSGIRGRVETSSGIQASLSGRYAFALFELAREQGVIDSVAASLARLREALAQSDDLRRLTASPLIGRAEAGRTIAAVASGLGLDETTTRFLGVLAANRRLGELNAVIRAFNGLVARHRGETTAEVVSAHPLDDNQMATLRTRLKSMVGSEVAVDARVDPAILGGLVVRMGSRQIDGSIRTKLTNLANAMKG